MKNACSSLLALSSYCSSCKCLFEHAWGAVCILRRSSSDGGSSASSNALNLANLLKKHSSLRIFRFPIREPLLGFTYFRERNIYQVSMKPRNRFLSSDMSYKHSQFGTFRFQTRLWISAGVLVTPAVDNMRNSSTIGRTGMQPSKRSGHSVSQQASHRFWHIWRRTDGVRLAAKKAKTYRPHPPADSVEGTVL